MTDRVFVVGEHLITECSRTKRRWGLQINGVSWCGNDMGEPHRYTREYPVDRAVEVTTSIPVRVGCVGCRVAAQSDARVRELVARAHGPLEPSYGV